MTEYLLDRNPQTGITETFEYDDVTGKITLRRWQDVEAAIDVNKGFHLYGDGKGRDMWYAASIPAEVAAKWLAEKGVNTWRKDHWPAVRKLLNDPEWKHLRPTSFRL
jgi:hypothetical protein